MFQLAKVFDNNVRMYITLEVLFGKLASAANESPREATFAPKGIKTYKGIIAKCVSHGSVPAADVLWAFDTYLEVNPEAAKPFPMVLKQIYDEDICTEEAI